MFATKKYIDDKIKNLTGENIKIAEEIYDPYGLKKIRPAKTIIQVFYEFREDLEKLEKEIEKLKSDIEIKEHLEREELFTIKILDNSHNTLISFENVDNALKKIDELLEKNRPFKLNTKLKNAYLEAINNTIQEKTEWLS